MDYKKNSTESDFLKSLQILGLTEKEIRTIAYQTGFMKRAPRKIGAPEFLENLCSISQQCSPSYNNLASRFHIAFDKSASKQAFWKRVNDSCVRFFQVILERVIQLKINNNEFLAYAKSCAYKRILVQDSTIIKLPTRLFSIFSGVRNEHSFVCNARIQGVYDLLSGSFISFSIDTYSKNDLTAAPELKLQEGDLVLRDRGYYINDEVQRHLNNRADCIYRYKHKTIFFDSVTGNRIDLLKELEKNKRLDMEVTLNNPDKTKVRLVAFPVNEEVGNKRRMKAKKKSRSKQNTSQEALKLMSWTIFLTTISACNASYEELMSMYRLRWRIEIIFKIWKSQMSFAHVHNVSQNQLNVILFSRFIVIAICICFVYYSYFLKIRVRFKKYLSMMKLVNYLMLNQNMLVKCLSLEVSQPNNLDPILFHLMKYCTYETRKRLNYCQLLEMTMLS